MNESIKPQIWMIAGPNGAGKSTLAIRFKVESRLPLVNPDIIAKEMNPDNPSAAAIQAGKEAIRKQKEYLSSGTTFAIETTMSGRRELDLLREAKAAGYKVNLVYCGVNSPERSIFRVKTRVNVGGHYVPPTDVIRRYGRSMENLPEALKIVDRAFVLDNSGLKHKLTMTQEHGIARFLTKDQPEWFKNACPDFPAKGQIIELTGAHLSDAMAKRIEALTKRDLALSRTQGAEADTRAAIKEQVKDLTVYRQKLQGAEKIVFRVTSRDVYMIAKSDELAKQLAQTKSMKKTKGLER